MAEETNVIHVSGGIHLALCSPRQGFVPSISEVLNKLDT